MEHCCTWCNSFLILLVCYGVQGLRTISAIKIKNYRLFMGEKMFFGHYDYTLIFLFMQFYLYITFLHY